MYGASSRRIRLDLNVEPITLNIDQAAPCGLVLTELLSNSLKYAFDGQKEGRITIEAAFIGNDDLQLVVRDNGPGIPEDLDIKQAETLGLRLVNILVERQLAGTVNLNRRHGAEFLITFRKKT